MSHAQRARMAGIMHICIHKRRLKFHPTSDEHDVFRVTSLKSSWPKYKVYLEWADGCFVELADDSELRLASKLVGAALYSEISAWDDDFRRREKKVEQHMAEPDSEPEPEMNADDDLTIDDLYSMGYRHEMEND